MGRRIVEHLIQLSQWLALQKFAAEQEKTEELTEYVEPWHEESVKEFGEEPISEDEYISREHSDLELEDIPTEYEYKNLINTELIRRIFERHQIHPVSVSGQPANLGRGLFGKVYRVIYRNRAAVAKIALQTEYLKTHYRGEFDEIGRWQVILAGIRDHKFTAEEEKHFPKVYDLIDDIIEVVEGVDVYYQVIVMEELFPINQELEAAFSAHHPGKILKDEDFLYEVAKNLTDTIAQFINFYFDPGSDTKFLRAISIPEVFKILYQNLTKLTNEAIINTSYALSTYFQTEVALLNLKMTEGDFTETFKNRMPHKIIEALTDYLKFNQYESDFPFPGDYDESPNAITLWEHQPETKTFTQALQTLMTDLRLGWKDLHPKNIMMDRDGNLKIIDVGLYEFLWN